MKGKPDTSAARVENFLRAGHAAAEAMATLAPVERTTKTFRIAPEVERALKRAVFESMCNGKRRNESDIIDAALRQYLKL
jgi:hypothetical protein